MVSADSINRFIGRYGCEVSLAPDGTTFGTPYKAFVQPLRYKNKMYLEGTRTRIGYTDQSYYLYVGPGDVNVAGLSHKAVLQTDGKKFYFSHSEPVRLADQTVYMWAVLRALVEEES